MLPLARILIGMLFIVSGGEKLIWPYQNFLYVIESYQILPGALETIVARVFPWIELFLGIFLVLGLWLSQILRGALVTSATFIVVVSQALVRQLPISECGCFGQLISLGLEKIILLDSGIFILILIMLWKFPFVSKFSLDERLK